MKKTALACALLATVGTSFAQSTATISGTIAAGYNKAIDGGKGLLLNDNSIRFSVTEDLGGGLKLSAFTQVKANSTRGGNVTKEDSAMALTGNFGAIGYNSTRTNTLARDYGLVGDNWIWDNPYTSNNKEVFSREATDVLSYTSPDMSGFKASVAMMETAADGAVTPSTKSFGVTALYGQGPLKAAIRAIRSDNDSWASNITKQSFDLGVNYDFGVAKVGVGYDSKRRGKKDTDKAAMTASVSAPLGPVTFGVNYGKRDVSNFMEVSAKYNLSKRSAVYLDYGKAKLADKSTNSQYNLVLVHNF